MHNILVIDDEPDLAELLGMQLELKGYKITICNDGADGIRHLKQGRYDLVIVDLFMPKKNGMDVALFIRNELPESQRNTPILAVTGGNGLLEAQKSAGKIEHFVNATVKKPFDYDVLHAKVRQLIAA